MSGKPQGTESTDLQTRTVGEVESDPRIRRTRDLLGDALVRLMQEKPFDAITVQELLDRAGVGRTTFYTHYRDKQDLFLSDVEEFLEGMSTLLNRRGAPARRIAPVEELFAHLADVRAFHEALSTSGKASEVRELGIEYFARSIEQRLARAAVALEGTELRASSHAFAGALFAQLEWWICHQASASPAEMDVFFHRLVWQGMKHSPESVPVRGR